ncbi:MOSC domain-containing protein [Segetibacter sp. 3557_3]|uniref:MOSC domain-containing protein n=1 Tax=Segetibacter sp. 3557_3 TaxID=2547429 RepID=UPI001404EA09|nr:MOSC domain-containing protein [Segetibacter sp. 3557_3]
MTSIFKFPVAGARDVTAVNIEGDEQSDLSVHGGRLKAVYSYDRSYYDLWKNIIDREDWSYGLFGENLTTEGLADDSICVGDVYQVGSVVLKAVQPRFPCFKLNIRFANNNMIQLFTKVARNGTYFSVLQPGRLQAGDKIHLVEKTPHQVTIQQLVDCYYNKGADKDLLADILKIDFLPEYLYKAFKSFHQ